MATRTMRHEPATSPLARWLLVGFISGALSVPIFHQGALAFLHAIGMTQAAPYSMTATAPFGIPALWSIAFWGGVWGMVLAATLRHLRDAVFVASAAIFGAVLPTLVAWLIVAPLKGEPAAAGLVPAAMIVGPFVNAAWGLGTAIGLELFGRPSPGERPPR